MAASNVKDNVEEINDVGRNVLAAVEFIFKAQDLVSFHNQFSVANLLKILAS